MLVDDDIVGLRLQCGEDGCVPGIADQNAALRAVGGGDTLADTRPEMAYPVRRIDSAQVGEVGEAVQTAAALLGAIAGLGERTGNALSPFHQRLIVERSAAARQRLAEIALAEGDLAETARAVSESLHYQLTVRWPSTEVVDCLWVGVCLLTAQQEYQWAATVLGSAEQMRRHIRYRSVGPLRPLYRRRACDGSDRAGAVSVRRSLRRRAADDAGGGGC